jgi:hypothetical protein
MPGLFESVRMSDDALAQMADIRSQADAMWSVIEKTPGSPERTIAQRKLEECVMWAVKNLSRNT